MSSVPDTQNTKDVRSKNGFNVIELLLSRDGNILRLLLIVIALFVFFSLTRPDAFPTGRNLQSMAFQASEFGLLAMAVALAMLTGGIDLSINATANLTGIIAGTILTAMLPEEGASTGETIAAVITALLAGAGVGFLCGLFNGLLIAVIGIPAILATLGTLILYEGIGTVITEGATVFAQQAINFIGSEEVLSVPVPFIILVVVTILLTLILNRTRFGFEVYMLGTNPLAARFSGVNNRNVLIRTYVICGLLSALAGIIVLGRTNSASVNFGGSYVLLAVLIAVLGGVDPYGGTGRMVGVLLAVIAVQFLSTGLNMLLVQYSGANFFKEFAWGTLLILILLLNYYINRRRT